MSRKWFFVLFFVVKAIYAQEPIHYFLGKDVFSGVQLYSIIEDSDNTMWITSNKGLFKYNGISITNVPIEESKSDALFGLTKDNNGNIYCFNLNGQVFKVANKKAKVYYTMPADMLGSYLAINFDNLNNLIINSKRKVVTVTPNKKVTISDEHKGYFTTKRNDTLYYGTCVKDTIFNIVKYVNKKETVFKNLLKENSRQVLYSKLYFCRNKLYTFSAKEKKLYVLKNDTFKSIPIQLPKHEDYGSFYSKGSFWFTAVKNGVYRIKLEELQQGKKPIKWFEDYRISGVYTDFEDNTWLLTIDEGIIIIPNLKISNFKIKDEKPSGIKKIDNKIYIGSRKNTIYKFKNGIFAPFFKVKNDRLETFNIFKEKNIVTSSKSVYINGKQLKNIINFNRGTVLVKDTIFAAIHAGFHKFNIRSGVLTKLDGRRTSSLCLAPKKDKIYILTANGLLKYDFNTITPVKFNNKILQPREIINVNDETWIASKTGIYVIKDGSFLKKITTEYGLLSNNVMRIKFEHPYVYIMNKKGFQQYNIETDAYKNLIEDYGLTQSIKNFEVLNDTIYALTSNGVLTFKLEVAQPKVTSYKTKITEATVNGNKAITNGALLKSNQNNVSFSFLTATYRYQKRIDYTYQLLGLDKKPIQAKNGQYFVNYSNLPAGNYTFKVQSTIYNKQSNPATISFLIQQIWHKTTWFKTIIVSLIILMLYAIYINRVKYLLRKRRQEQFEKELAESSLTSLKSQMNPHFMFNAMNSVQSLILKDEKDNAYSYLTRLSQLIREILNMSDKTWVYLDEEVEQITNYLELEKLRFGSEFSYKIDIDDKVLDTIMIPSMIIQPFIENSVKHGLLHKNDEKHITITFKMQHESLVCIIEDNGIGREASYKINNSEDMYKVSFSTNAIQKRFELYKKHLNKNVGFEYDDLYNKQKRAIGTRVTVKTPYKTDEE